MYIVKLELKKAQVRLDANGIIFQGDEIEGKKTWLLSCPFHFPKRNGDVDCCDMGKTTRISSLF